MGICWDASLSCNSSPRTMAKTFDLRLIMFSLSPLFFSWWLSSADIPRVIPQPCSDQRFWHCPSEELFPFVYIWRTLDDSGIANSLSDIPSGAQYKKYVGLFKL